MTLKSAYELSLERTILPTRYKNNEPSKKNGWDFIPIPEFDDKDPVTVNSYNNNDGDAEETSPIDVSSIEKKMEERMKDEDLEVIYNGNLTCYTGFAKLNRNIVFGLSNMGVKVKIEDESISKDVNGATFDLISDLKNTDVSPSAPKIYGVTVPLNMAHSGKKILYTMMETSKNIHPDYRGKLNMVDEIWVPTEFNRKLFKQSGVHPPIYVMPLGVDVDRYVPDLDPLPLKKNLNGFVFLSVFRWQFRKGFDVLLKAYLEEFSSRDDVSLLIVSKAYSSEGGDGKIVGDFNDIKAGINKKEADMPHVSLYSKAIGEKDMPRLYNSADAYVCISRGEGWGLPFAESGACELPVIASNCTGQTDFLNEENSFLVEPDDYVQANINGAFASMAKQSRFFEGQFFPDFQRGAIERTMDHMRYVYESYDDAKLRAKKLRSLLCEKYLWKDTVAKIYNRISEINKETVK